MAKVIIIGAGGVGRVVAHKCSNLAEIFGEVVLASRTISKCEVIQKELKNNIIIEQLDADDPNQVAKLISKYKAELVINVALPYQDLSIMDGCLLAGANYIDTANYEPKDVARFEYKWQWGYKDKFLNKNLMAILGCGFDPGVTNIFCAHAAKNHFDEIHYVDILDCNAGDHGHSFATNFNPEINIREITQKGKYWENGKWIEIPPLSEHFEFDYPDIGKRSSYLLYHEELESLVKNLPHLKRIRFYMTFGEEYLTHLRVLQNVGITSIHPVKYKNIDVVPLEFLKLLLPDPASLAKNYKGKTCIGNIIEGVKDGKNKKIYIYNICSHEEAYKETLSQAISYTTGVPVFIGAMLMLNKTWLKSGVYNVEELNPDPFMKLLMQHGLPWVEKIL